MAYYMSDVIDPRVANRLSPNKDCSLDELRRIGVHFIKVDFDAPDSDDQLEKIAKQFDMNHRDIVEISAKTMPDFGDKLKMFFREHLHNDAELRVVKEGNGYFDVRDDQDRWIRIPVTRGDFVFLPSGIYHRFSPDTEERVVAVRLFRSNPKWQAHNRDEDGDQQTERHDYLKSIKAN